MRLASWLVLASAGVAAIPVIPSATLRLVGHTAEGTTRPIVAEWMGRRYIFKKDTPFVYSGRLICSTGNFESELLAHQIHALLGVRGPDVHAVRLEGKPELLLRIELADASFTRAEDAVPLKLSPIRASHPIDEDAARKLALTDLLIGNPDRHGGNLLVYRHPQTRIWTPIPIDHNMALLTAPMTSVKEWILLPLPLPGTPFEAVRWYGDRYLHRFGENPFFRRALSGAAAHAETLRVARTIQEALTDATFVKMMRAIPREVLREDREAEILDILRDRRDGLLDFVDRYFEAGGCDD